MTTKLAYTLFLFALSLQRLWELQKSNRHQRSLLAQGGREHSPGHFPAMAMLHSTWIIAMGAEVWFFDRPLHHELALIACAVFLIGQLLRLWAMRDLGERWCARIITLPQAAPIRRGIYRYVRHPNYVGVVIEIAAAPLIHSAYITAIVFTALNAWLLVVRIKAEEQALYG